MPASLFADWTSGKNAGFPKIAGTLGTTGTGEQNLSISATLSDVSVVPDALSPAGTVGTGPLSPNASPTSLAMSVPAVPAPSLPLGTENCIGNQGGSRSSRGSHQNEQCAPKPNACTPLSEAEQERAAIIEYDGGIPQAWSEGLAWLDPDRPPADVPLRRWQRFVEDVGRFLDNPFCAVAIKLGWGPFDLFGCDGDRPHARIDQAGLLWLLHGGELVELTATAATIETRTGERHAFRRKPGEPSRVLVWEIV
jgi:hypothetical protein